MDRRAFLAGAATAVASTTAGCLGGGAESHPGPSRTPSGTASNTPPREETWHDRVAFEDVDREVYVEAERYRFLPGTERPIRVHRAERVGIAVTALDHGYHSGHGLYVPAFDVDLQALPGGAASTTFLADESGEFEIACDVYCGAGHEEMNGTLVVEA